MKTLRQQCIFVPTENCRIVFLFTYDNDTGGKRQTAIEYTIFYVDLGMMYSPRMGMQRHNDSARVLLFEVSRKAMPKNNSKTFIFMCH